MFILPYTREVLMQVMPSGGDGAEIGVDRGVFSSVLLEHMQPNNLLLVDPWVHQTREDYQLDPTNEPDAVMAARYEAVTTKFGDESRVSIWRTESLAAAEQFRAQRIGAFRLTWVYIDAVHSYEAVLADLRAWSQCVADDGVIMGHDFSNHAMAEPQGIGVMQAVYEFVTESEWELLAITNEAYASYVLVKDREMQKAIVGNFITAGPCLVEIRDTEKMHIGQSLVPIKGGRGKGFLAIEGQPVSILTVERA